MARLYGWQYEVDAEPDTGTANILVCTRCHGTEVINVEVVGEAPLEGMDALLAAVSTVGPQDAATVGRCDCCRARLLDTYIDN